MRRIWVVTAPSGYWEGVFQSIHGAEEFLEEYFPPLSIMGYSIVEWDATLVESKESSDGE